jgi:Uma2 family endonuclease
MSVRTRRLTYDDLLRTPDDGNRYEIIDGEVLVSPSPGRYHQRLVYLLTRLVGDKVDADRWGQLFSGPVDVRLGPHNIVVPDLLYIRQDRLSIFTPRLVEGPPDLIIEVASPSTKKIDGGDKMALYAHAGVPEYWLPDPETRTFRMSVLQANGMYHDAEPVDGRFHSTVIDGLVIDPAALFADFD